MEMKYAINGKKDAIIIVDVQKDFCPGGALPTPAGDKIIPTLNDYVKKFSKSKALIVATRDWHPPNHTSFKEYGGAWPPHCIQETKGAEFHPELSLPKNTKVVSKGSNPAKEAYSGFDGTDLDEELKSLGIKRLFIGGIATEYCVKNTVLDALRLGFETVLLVDAIQGIDADPDISKRAVEEMLESGAKKINISDLE
jgi:nicotinamidase/pyrazinamidase